MSNFKNILMGAACFLLPGCGSNSIETYQDRPQKFDLRNFFEGDVEGSGAIFDLSGVQTRSFTVKLKGTWTGNKGVLQEWFVFNDGEKTERTWTITFNDDTHFTGSAGDVVVPAEGSQRGNAVNMSYVLRVPYKESTIDLSMDDWMYLIEEGLVLNRTSMKKFGFKVGEIVLFMKKSK